MHRVAVQCRATTCNASHGGYVHCVQRSNETPANPRNVRQSTAQSGRIRKCGLGSTVSAGPHESVSAKLASAMQSNIPARGRLAAETVGKKKSLGVFSQIH